MVLVTPMKWSFDPQMGHEPQFGNHVCKTIPTMIASKMTTKPSRDISSIQAASHHSMYKPLMNLKLLLL